MQSFGASRSFLIEYYVMNEFKDKSVIVCWHNDEYECEKFQNFIMRNSPITVLHDNNLPFLEMNRLLDFNKQGNHITSYLTFDTECHLLVFDKPEEAEKFWKENIPDGDLNELQFPYCNMFINGKYSGENT